MLYTVEGILLIKLYVFGAEAWYAIENIFILCSLVFCLEPLSLAKLHHEEYVVTLAQKQCNCQMSTFQERQKTFLFQTFTFSHIKNQL